jgi:hypothetical protein
LRLHNPEKEEKLSLFQGIRDIHEDSLILFKLLGYGDRSLITDSMEKETRKKNMDGLAKIRSQSPRGFK